MKKHAHISIFLGMIVLCAFLVSCKSGKVDPPGPDDKEDPKATSYVIPNSAGVSKVSYYSVSADGRISTASFLVDDSTAITPELILGYFTDALEDESIDIVIDDTSVVDGICRISFDDSIYDVAAMGKQVEQSVLDAAAQSILDNIEDVKGVSFYINGKEYSTKNYTLVLNSIYMGK
ncbi:MAG: GerMN domain-containing protein [Lachnospiraceae bacterium]|nr:GerMN domain-containing protein [Lachnospiraceae bacterium]